MRSIKKIVGRILYYGIGIHLPVSYSKIKIGQRRFREFCGRLMLDIYGESVNIEGSTVFTQMPNWQPFGNRCEC